jgi:hypothetical protein
MVYISTVRTVWNKYTNLYPYPGNFENKFTITPNFLNYKFVQIETGRIVWEFTLELDELKKHQSFCDQSWFGFYDLSFVPAGVKPIPVYTTIGCPYNVNLKHSDLASLIDITNKRESTKEFLWMKHEDGVGQIPMRFFVPFSSGDFTDFTYQVVRPRNPKDGNQKIHDITVSCNIDYKYESGQPERERYQPGWKWFFCPINLYCDETKAGEILKCKIEVIDTNSRNLRKDFTGNTIHERIEFSLPGVAKKLKSIFINGDEVFLKEGIGEYLLDTNGMSAGEEIILNAGYKLIDSVAILKTILK